MAKLYGKWEGMEEVNKTNLAIGVPSLKGCLLALGRLKVEKITLQRQLKLHRQVLAYLMGEH